MVRPIELDLAFEYTFGFGFGEFACGSGFRTGEALAPGLFDADLFLNGDDMLGFFGESDLSGVF